METKEWNNNYIIKENDEVKKWGMKKQERNQSF